MLDEDRPPPTGYEADNAWRARGSGSSHASARLLWECLTVDMRICLAATLEGIFAYEVKSGRDNPPLASADDARMQERFCNGDVCRVIGTILREIHELGPGREVHRCLVAGVLCYNWISALFLFRPSNSMQA